MEIKTKITRKKKNEYVPKPPNNKTMLKKKNEIMLKKNIVGHNTSILILKMNMAKQ